MDALLRSKVPAPPINREQGKRENMDYNELHVEAQNAVDRCVAARAEMDASIANINDVRAKIDGASKEAEAFIDAYLNPSVPNPAPIVPEVAAPAPDVEPAVYTTVSDSDVAADNSSGGVSDVSEAFDVLTPDPVEVEAAAPVEAAPAEETPASETVAGDGAAQAADGGDGE